MSLVRNVLCLCGVLVLVILVYSDCFSLDPKFELKPAELGSHRPGIKERSPSAKKTAAAPKIQRQKTARDERVAVTRKRSKSATASRRGVSRTAGRKTVPGKVSATQTLRLTVPMPAGLAELARIQDAWGRLMPESVQTSAGASVRGENFSLALDPERYPVFPAADGGSIILDADQSLSPLVKTILQGQEPRMRVISATPDGSSRFFSAVLAASRFYSVEDSFSLRLGTDPQVTVRADFKIEKNQDSVLQDDIVLLNTADQRTAMPRELRAALAGEGFTVVEVASFAPLASDGSKILYSITASDQRTMVDELAAALDIPGDKDRDLVLDDGAGSGVMLTVRAHRYFERDGIRTVISFAEDNPVQSTLLRFVEMQGYRVVMVNPADDFPATSEKVLAALGIPVIHGVQTLDTSTDIPFSVKVSGVTVQGGKHKATRTILTSKTIDPLTRTLATALGFAVVLR